MTSCLATGFEQKIFAGSLSENPHKAHPICAVFRTDRRAILLAGERSLDNHMYLLALICAQKVNNKALLGAKG